MPMTPEPGHSSSAGIQLRPLPQQQCWLLSLNFDFVTGVVVAVGGQAELTFLSLCVWGSLFLCAGVEFFHPFLEKKKKKK